MSERRVLSIPLKDIHADEEFNCRGHITAVDVVDLAKDIKANGLIQPVVIREYDATMRAETDCKYLLIAGYRRYMAHVVNEAITIDAIIRNDMDDPVKARFFNLSENLKRKDLNIVQEAAAMAKLVSLGVGEHHIAEMLGVSRGWVQVRKMLLRLPREVQAEAAAGIIKQTDIRELFSVLRTHGQEACFEAVRKLKDAMIRGRKISVSPTKNNPNTKRHRKRGEIFEMMEHIQDSGIGNGLHTRTLAWAAGEITTGELVFSLEEYSIEHDLEYRKLEMEEPKKKSMSVENL